MVKTLTVCLLACVGAVPVLAQEPSPLVLPPPWFGGQRVEMPEHGFALTVPDDWVAFDLAVDAVSQLAAAAGHLDPDVWSPEVADLLAEAASEDATLILGDARSDNTCAVMSPHGVAMPLDDWADWFADRTAVHPGYRDVESPQRLDLPAGPAYLIRLAGVDDLDRWLPKSFFMLGEQTSLVAVLCSNATRTDDLWLSIVESFESLDEEEPSPAAS